MKLPGSPLGKYERRARGMGPHGGLFEGRPFLGQLVRHQAAGLGLIRRLVADNHEILGEIPLGEVIPDDITVQDHVSGQATVQVHFFPGLGVVDGIAVLVLLPGVIQRWVGSAMAGDPGDEERVAGTLRVIRFRPLTGVVGMFPPLLVDLVLVPGFHFDSAALRFQTHPRGVGRHGERGHGHEGRNRRAGFDLAVRVGSVPSFPGVGNALFVELGPGLEHVVDRQSDHIPSAKCG